MINLLGQVDSQFEKPNGNQRKKYSFLSRKDRILQTGQEQLSVVNGKALTASFNLELPSISYLDPLNLCRFHLLFTP